MKIGIVGLGLIGGSVALASSNSGHDVVGYDIDPDVISKAIDNKAITHEMTLDNMTTTCDIIVLCTPPRIATQIVEQALAGNAVVTDVSSVKKPICDVVDTLSEQQKERFIGGHPMAGSEQSGFDASRTDLFERKMWVIVPPEDNSLKHVSTIERFVTSLGAEHCVLSAAQHDSLVAHISHLPHLASTTLMGIATNEAIDNEIILRLAGGGFRDMTRISASNTQMWMDIVHDNANEISKALSEYIDELTKVKGYVEQNDTNSLEEMFISARKSRSSLPEVARRFVDLAEILIPVPDTPGVLATITALTKDINVYDIKIVHALEEDRGVLSLVVQPAVADELVIQFNNAGFVAFRNELD